MIAHHQQALEMADMALYGRFPDAQQMAQSIVEVQSAEIDEMKTMLTR